MSVINECTSFCRGACRGMSQAATPFPCLSGSKRSGCWSTGMPSQWSTLLGSLGRPEGPAVHLSHSLPSEGIYCRSSGLPVNLVAWARCGCQRLPLALLSSRRL